MGGTLSSSLGFSRSYVDPSVYGGPLNTSNSKEMLSGKTVLVTGANSGIGYETALQLSAMGANVVLACRSAEKGAAALEQMKAANPTGSFELRLLDLSSLADVERFAMAFNNENRPIDILVNNAGIRSSTYVLTPDGFESQLGTNYLGHYALVGRLMPSLQQSKAPRVVSVGSLMAKNAKKPGLSTGEPWTRATAHLIAVDFKKSAETYNADDCYAESKCANLMFMRELGKRHPRILSVAGHPGGTATNIFADGEYAWVRWALQRPAAGALPIIRAASDPSLLSGAYFGPRYGLRGPPATAWFPRVASDNELCKAYWDAAGKATGVVY